MKLEELQKGVLVDGLVPGHIATIVSADAIGANVVNVIFKCDGTLHEQQVFRTDEAKLSIAQKNLPWTFDAPSRDFKRALETTSTRKTAKLLARMEGKVSADDIRQLAYYLYTYNERKGDAAQARAYNALVTAWSDLSQLVTELHVQEGPKMSQGELGI